MIAIDASDDFARRWSAAEPLLRRALAARVASAADRDDALQDAALIAWRRHDAYDRGRPFGAWAFGIARRCLALRQRAGTVGLDACAALAAPQDDRAEQEQWLRAALARLAPADRDLLLLAHVEGLPLAALGERFGCCARTAGDLLARAEDRLRAAAHAAAGG